MKNAFTAFAAVTVLAGCAATYKQPNATEYQPLSGPASGSKAELMRKTRQILVLDGFQITNTDDTAGVVSTAPRNFRVSPEQADCGTTMGLAYLKDNRTDTKLGYGVLVADGKVTIRATIEAQYKPGAIDQNIMLTCVSRGGLESALLRRIQGAT